VYRLGASVEYRSRSRFCCMFATTASVMSRAWRRGGDAAGSVVCETMAPGKIYAANAAKS
jgi:hypothetical protein